MVIQSVYYKSNVILDNVRMDSRNGLRNVTVSLEYKYCTINSGSQITELLKEKWPYSRLTILTAICDEATAVLDVKSIIITTTTTPTNQVNID